jgi:NAD(P)H-dependent flavin oxidoreductase YrpB (nitropropane dioxygenase family)
MLIVAGRAQAGGQFEGSSAAFFGLHRVLQRLHKARAGIQVPVGASG